MSSTVADPDAREKLHIAQVLLGRYAALSVLTLLAIVVFSCYLRRAESRPYEGDRSRPRAASGSRASLRRRPSSVREYSTRGGTSS